MPRGDAVTITNAQLQNWRSGNWVVGDWYELRPSLARFEVAHFGVDFTKPLGIPGGFHWPIIACEPDFSAAPEGPTQVAMGGSPWLASARSRRPGGAVVKCAVVRGCFESGVTSRTIPIGSWPIRVSRERRCFRRPLRGGNENADTLSMGFRPMPLTLFQQGGLRGFSLCALGS